VYKLNTDCNAALNVPLGRYQLIYQMSVLVVGVLDACQIQCNPKCNLKVVGSFVECYMNNSHCSHITS